MGKLFFKIGSYVSDILKIVDDGGKGISPDHFDPFSESFEIKPAKQVDEHADSADFFTVATKCTSKLRKLIKI